MNEPQSTLPSPVLVAMAISREPIAFGQFAREHANAFGRPLPVSAP